VTRGSVRDKGFSGKSGQLPGGLYHLRCAEREVRRSVVGEPEISIDVGVRGYGLLEGQGQFYNFARFEHVIAFPPGGGVLP